MTTSPGPHGDLDEGTTPNERETAKALEEMIAVGWGRQPSALEKEFGELTPREREVLDLMARGISNGAIADKQSGKNSILTDTQYSTARRSRDRGK